jgi:energy-coupling factor transport system ATP-binding protein
VVRLGQALGWDPLPLSVRDARRRAAGLRAELAGQGRPHAAERGPLVRSAAPALSARRVVVRYGSVLAVASVDLALAPGEVVALMGRNGSGKSSLLWALQGAGPRQGGSVALADGTDPATLAPAQARGRVGLVPQSPGDLLFLTTVDGECALADREGGRAPGSCRALLDRLVPGVPGDVHPRDLSEGQRLALALAVQLCPDPEVVLLDEPTRGLDEAAKARFAGVVRDLAAQGRAVVVATHDVELVAHCADRVVVLAEGEVVADGPTADVVVASPVFAPQVSKVVQPLPWLTVDDVRAGLAAAGR